MAPKETFTTAMLDDLRRRADDALDLAIAAGAPLTLLEKLGAASGLLRALAEVPNHVLMPPVVTRATKALRTWEEWRQRLGRKPAA